MFAIIEIGGQQFKVEKGTKLEVGQLPEKEGSTIEINRVFLLNDNGKVTIGTPYVVGAFASAKVVSHQRGDKVMVYKMKAKKRYRRTKGHRQHLSTVEITDIKTTGGKDPGKRLLNTIIVQSPKIQKKVATTKEAKPKAAKKTAPKKAVAKKTTKKAA